MIATTSRRRRWRPRWLTTRAIALGAVFTMAIFVVVLGIASVFAGQFQNIAPSKPVTPVQVVSPADHHGDGPAGTEPDD